MRIWIYLNGIQQGPYTLEQIRLLPVDASTPVWYEGLAQWTPAGQAAATASLFSAAETPAADTAAPAGAAEATPAEPAAEPLPARPSTYLVWNIIFTILCCCPVSLAGIITGALSSSRYAAGDYDGARRLSEATEWLLIISVVWIVLSVPFSLLFI